jgi:F-type H+-transporting ATPase subunit a
MRNRILLATAGFIVIGAVLWYLGIKLTRADLAISVIAEPVVCIGGVLEGEHCSAETIFPITNSLILTAIIDIILLLTAIFATRNMQLIPRGFQNLIETMVEAFYNFAQGVDPKNVAKFFPICATIFFFVLFSNLFALIPVVPSVGTCVEESAVAHESTVAGAPGEAAPAAGEAAPTETSPATEKEKPSAAFSGLPGYCENGHVVPYLRAPTADLNNTLALALLSVVMIQVFGVQALGAGYFSKFINVREGIMGFMVGLIEIISELARILSFAFRLFGNIFAGEVILIVMSFLVPYLLPVPFFGLELFVAFMQAIIFSVLTLVFMSLATQAHGGHDDHGHAAPMPVEAGDVPGHGGH